MRGAEPATLRSPRPWRALAFRLAAEAHRQRPSIFHNPRRRARKALHVNAPIRGDGAGCRAAARFGPGAGAPPGRRASRPWLTPNGRIACRASSRRASCRPSRMRERSGASASPGGPITPDITLDRRDPRLRARCRRRPRQDRACREARQRRFRAHGRGTGFSGGYGRRYRRAGRCRNARSRARPGPRRDHALGPPLSLTGRVTIPEKAHAAAIGGGAGCVNPACRTRGQGWCRPCRCLT